MDESIDSGIQAQYRNFQTKVLDYLNRSGALYAQAVEATRGAETTFQPQALVDKLRDNAFNLVLIGAFQSGKSTLFNYLCGGRELSPIGPGGGGIRTSGCQVSAHYLRNEENEYAEVAWRTPDELLMSLGSTLSIYYNNKPLTREIVNLEDAAARKRLAENAWDMGQKSSGDSGSGNDLDSNIRELLRFALIVGCFYDQFMQNRGKTHHKVDESVSMGAYPQDWEKRWSNVKSVADVAHLFKPEEVSFAFIASIDLHLNAPALEQLGCTIIDCPGLFVSKWDTMIAERCIREADAILYMMPGEKALTAEDIKALQTCVQKGGKYKLLFGANLRTSETNWKRILEEAVLPKLKDEGFPNPEVHAFHAGLALRSLEYSFAEGGILESMLPISAQAIKRDIELSGKEVDLKAYLKRQINKFLTTLTDGEETLGDYDDDFKAIETKSGVSNFVEKGAQYVLKHKAYSLLVGNGVGMMLRELNQQRELVAKQLDSLKINMREAQDDIRQSKSNLRVYKDTKNMAIETIDNALKETHQSLTDHYKSVAKDILRAHWKELVDVTKKEGSFINGLKSKVSSQTRAKWVDKYSQKLSVVLNTIQRELQESIERELKETWQFGRLRDKFRESVEHVLEVMALGRKLPDLDSVDIHINLDDIQNIVVMKDARALIEDVSSSMQSDSILAILTFGTIKFFKSTKKWANATLDKHKGIFETIVERSVEYALSPKRGCFQLLFEHRDELDQLLKDRLAQEEKALEEARRLLESSSQERTERIQKLEELAPRLESICEEGRRLRNEIELVFPPVY